MIKISNKPQVMEFNRPILTLYELQNIYQQDSIITYPVIMMGINITSEIANQTFYH